MKVFTYENYIEIIHTLRLNAVLQLAEEKSNYCVMKSEENSKSHDKLIKSVLKDKIEILKFINQFIYSGYEIETDDIITFTNSYVTEKYKSKEADLVYKLKNEEIFF